MAQTQGFEFESNVTDIANFKQDNRRKIGHLTKLIIGGEELKADFSFADPMDPAKRIAMCAMIIFLDWDTTAGGILHIPEHRLSAKNQSIYNDIVESFDKPPECDFVLDCYQYDDETEKYFKCFHTDGKVMKGRLSEERKSKASTDVADDYRQIRNHKAELYVVGSDKLDQFFQRAYDPNRKKPLRWGQKAKA